MYIKLYSQDTAQNKGGSHIILGAQLGKDFPVYDAKIQIAQLKFETIFIISKNTGQIQFLNNFFHGKRYQNFP